MLIGLPKKVTKLQNNHHENPNTRPNANSDTSLVDNLTKRCNNLESEMLTIRT